MTLPDAARVETSVPPSNAGQHRFDLGRELARLEPVEERLALGVRLGPCVETDLPLRVRGGAALPGLAGVLDDVLGDDEGLLGVEPEHLLRGGELGCTERGPVDLPGVLLAGARPPDDRLQDDDRRFGGLALRRLDGPVELGDVFDVLAGLLPVDGLHVPSIGLVPLSRRLR